MGAYLEPFSLKRSLRHAIELEGQVLPGIEPKAADSWQQFMQMFEGGKRHVWRGIIATMLEKELEVGVIYYGEEQYEGYDSSAFRCPVGIGVIAASRSFVMESRNTPVQGTYIDYRLIGSVSDQEGLHMAAGQVLREAAGNVPMFTTSSMTETVPGLELARDAYGKRGQIAPIKHDAIGSMMYKGDAPVQVYMYNPTLG